MNTTGLVRIKAWAGEASLLCGRLLKEQAVPLFLIFAVATAISLSLEHLIQNLSRADEDQRWILQLGLGLVDLFQGVILILVLAWGVPKVRELTVVHFCRHPFQSSYLNSFLAEYLRMLAQVILYALLFLVPGFFRYGRLIFVPYVALFAQPYREDRVDALKLSAELTRGRLKLILTTVVLTMALQIGLELLPQGESMHGLVPRLICETLSFVISVWSFSFVFVLFEAAMEDYDWRQLNGAKV